MTVTNEMDGIEPLLAMDGVIEKQEQQQDGSGMKESPSAGPSQGDIKLRRNQDIEENVEDTEVDDVEDNDENDKEEEKEEEEEEVVIAAYASPANVVLQRDSLTAEDIEAEIESLHGMWEMASILDFFHLFRKQLRLTRHFAANELERVLVTSPGDTGLLADIHIDLMRGISPKNEISTTNWQIHLANKIKFHWRNLNDGTPCPFKPEKYLEAISYAELPAAYRVRALHFLCCIRLDREDIGLRMFEAERPKTESEVAEIEAAQEAARLRASRSTRSSRITIEDNIETELLDTLDTFRREPTGVDSSGAAYYYFEHVETTGFRVYKEIVMAPSKKSSLKDNNNSDNDDEDDLSPEDLEREAAERAAAESKMGRKRRERALKKMPLVKSKYALRDHPKPKPWKLIVTTVEELIALGEALAFGEASLEADKTLGQLFLEEFVPQLQEKAEAEEKKRRAAERVRSRLGVGGEGGQGGGSGDAYYGRDSNGGGGMNAAGGGDGVEGHGGGIGYGANGRSRRARTQVNYAFNEYDTLVKSAIRRSQKGGRDDSPSGWDDQDGGGSGGRRSRRGGSPVILTGEEAAMLGLRRGRSHTTGVDSGTDLNERALRQQRAERNNSGGMYRSDTDASLLDAGGIPGATRGGSYETQSSGGGGGGRRGSGGGRSRLAPKYARDYVTDGGGTEDSDGPLYVARPSKKRGRPSKTTSVAAAAASGGGVGGVAVQNRSAAVEGILAQEQKHDAEIMNHVAAAEQQQNLQQQQQAQAMLAQRQQVLQRIQHIQMLQAQGLPIPPDQLQFLSMLGQYQQQRQQHQLSQQGVYNAAAAAPAPTPGGGVYSGSLINQSFAGIPIQQPQQQQVAPLMGTSTANGVMIPIPGAPAAPAAPLMMPQGYQGQATQVVRPAQQPTYFNQNVEAAVVPAPAAQQQQQQQQQQQEAGDASLAQWGGSKKRTQPTSRRVPPPP
ncbi:hypothetical protein Ndes2526B_g06619 [Nannochloris sp. 'desiccata']|nr:putative DDT domain-containing protein DDR4 [Chlorella desiccata (nom. nud.)]